MRKQLLALLSVLGLAGSSSPASAQVSKGAIGKFGPKSESTVKQSKIVQEGAISKHTTKLTKAAHEQDAAGKIADTKRKSAKREAGKINSEAERKDRVSAMRDAHMSNAVKGKAEKKASRSESSNKMVKANVENSGVRNEAANKVKAGIDSSSVKTSGQVSANGGGAGKAAAHDIIHTDKKNPAEFKAAREDANLKLKTQTGKASHK